VPGRTYSFGVTTYIIAQNRAQELAKAACKCSALRSVRVIRVVPVFALR
jgi:hypothetical protein